jgi:transcriptional regulator with XRE-family HTH domain
MADKKQYDSVLEMMKDIQPNSELNQELGELIDSRKLMTRLMSLRALAGLSQADVSRKMECTQSRISKLENGTDDDIKLGDMKAYAEAVRHELIVGFKPRGLSAADQVKGHFCMINQQLIELVELAAAQHDDEVTEEIASFLNSFTGNMFLMMQRLSQGLPPLEDGTSCYQFEVVENQIAGEEG